MSFKWAYAAFTLALVVAACGNPSTPNTASSSGSTASTPAGDMAKAAAVMGAMAAGGGPGKNEMKTYLTGLAQVGDALASVKDEASAHAAAAKINQIGASLQDEVKKLDGLSDTDKAAALLASGPELMQMQQKMTLAVQNIGVQNDLMTIVQPELDKLPQLK